MGQPDPVTPQLFADLSDELLETTTEAHQSEVVLLDPFYISRDTTGNSVRSRFLETLPAYIKTVHRMSKRYRTRLVRTHDVFQRHLQYREADFFAPEPVHPYHIGHVIVAHELFKALSR